MVEKTLLLAAVCMTERIPFAASAKKKQEEGMKNVRGVSLAGKLLPH